MNAPTVAARSLLALVFALYFVAAGLAAPGLAAPPSPGEEDGAKVQIDSWLILGPSPWPLPAFAEASYGAGELLQEPSLDLEGLWPAEGSAQILRPGSLPAAWSVSAPWTKNKLHEDVPYKAWAASYVEVGYFSEVELEVTSRHPVVVFLDGEEVASRPKPGDDDGPLTAELSLSPGKHLLLDHMLVSRPLLGSLATAEIHNTTLSDEMVGYANDGTSPDSFHAPMVVEFALPGD